LNRAWQDLDREIVACARCPRLAKHRAKVCLAPPKRFRGETYWGKPITSFGDRGGRLLIVGLAPGAQGANRTGRVFTGDESGRWLYRALFAAGFANQPQSIRPGDGLELTDCLVSAAVRCAPPGNRPAPLEKQRCSPFLQRELELMPQLAVVLALGGFAWDATLFAWAQRGHPVPKPKPRFSHLAEVRLEGGPLLLGSYHVSQQNTFTGRLTEPMLNAVFDRARRALRSGTRQGRG
jgi:uracil-DNA glycosylase family 4